MYRFYTLIHQISDTASSIPPCSTFWSHEHAKHSPNASTNHTKTNDNARALKMFARGQLKVLQMAVSAIGAAGPGSPDERRAWQVVLRRGQCHAAMQLRLRVAVSPRQCVVWRPSAALVDSSSPTGEQVISVESSSSTMLEAQGSWAPCANGSLLA